MKIVLKDLSIPCKSIAINKGVLKIKTDISQDTSEIIKLFDEKAEITYYDDKDEILGIIESGYELKYIVESPYDITYVIEIPYTEPDMYDMSALVEQITNIELALCEIYESMEV